MIDYFADLKGLIRFEEISIDNKVFLLHHKATFNILVLTSLLVTCSQYIGDPIDCIVAEIPNDARNIFILFLGPCCLQQRGL